MDIPEITEETVARLREQYRTEPLTPEDVACYRVNYDVAVWARSECSNSIPFGAVLAIERLCCEVERLSAKSARSRHEGRMEALNAVFQINGPSRAIARLTEKYAAELKL